MNFFLRRFDICGFSAYIIIVSLWRIIYEKTDFEFTH